MRRKTSSAVEIPEQMVGDDVELRTMIAEESLNAEVARIIYDARVAAGLTQKQLAQLVGTRQPVIARLEDADYRGHSLSMLQRIARALGRRIELRLVTPRRTRTGP